MEPGEQNVSDQSQGTQPTIIQIVNQMDPSQLQALVNAFAIPWSQALVRTRRSVLYVASGLIAMLVIFMFVLAILGFADGNSVLFALGTALGFTFGFLTRFLSNN